MQVLRLTPVSCMRSIVLSVLFGLITCAKMSYHISTLDYPVSCIQINFLSISCGLTTCAKVTSHVLWLNIHCEICILHKKLSIECLVDNILFTWM